MKGIKREGQFEKDLQVKLCEKKSHQAAFEKWLILLYHGDWTRHGLQRRRVSG